LSWILGTEIFIIILDVLIISLLLSVVRSLYLFFINKNHKERLKSIIGFKFVEQFYVNNFDRYIYSRRINFYYDKQYNINA